MVWFRESELMGRQPVLAAHGTDGHDDHTLLAQSYGSRVTKKLDARSAQKQYVDPKNNLSS
jgi:hypothetical protein